ncbi:unnamed protein product [Lymnaea stagnalis]|uniref:IRF tryptophan pentad repeat domain-containing protein n=1 Tax=Lymnaea stagnalis TaxID=6523 RepID=A0AAV2IN83_LYMST
MENHRESRKRLRPWLERMINMAECPGLVWENKEERTFRIPWRHFNNKEWVEEDSKIFREWAKYTGKYQDGDKLEYPVWKTRLRCALKKIPEIKEVPEQHRIEDVNPYRVYKFVDVPVMKRVCELDTDSCNSQASCNSHQGSSPYRKDYLEEPSNSPPNFLKYVGGDQHSNVPTVVYDDENCAANYSQFNVRKENPTSFLSMLNDCSKPFLDMRDQNDISEYSGYKSQYMEECIPQYSVNDAHGMPLRSTTVLSEVTAYNTDTENTQSENGEINASLPADLMSVDSTDLCVLANMELPASISSLNTQSLNLSMEGGQTQSLSNATASLGNGIRLGSLQDSCNSIEVTVIYGSPSHQVLAKTIQGNGCRLYYSNTSHLNLNDKKIEETLFGPKDVNQIALPSLVQCPFDVSDDQRRLIHDLLDNMERGIVLTLKDGDIFVQRLCRTRVYLTNGTTESILLERKNRVPTLAFDFAKFRHSFQTCSEGPDGSKKELPKPFFILTLGQEIKKSHYNPMNNILIHIVVKHQTAAKLMSQSSSMSSTSGQFYSSYDSYDKILDEVKKISLKS